uniref:hypothetical protein n=1 Tax=Enterocloster clostridioformis TaxID=1531 RepID=UPI0025A62099|nr:hypothetical protein [Enterocloster clostridioformis]
MCTPWGGRTSTRAYSLLSESCAARDAKVVLAACQATSPLRETTQEKSTPAGVSALAS